MGNEAQGQGSSGDGEGRLLQPIWYEVERPAATGRPGESAPQADPQHERLLQSARAVHALNERLCVDMEVPAHQLARDRLVAFVAKVSALSGVRPDELVIGSGSDAFVVQNDAAGRTIAKFDTHDAVNTPVGDSLDGLSAAMRRQAPEHEALQHGIDRLVKAPALP